MCGAERATLHCGAWAPHCGGFSRCRAQALGTRAPSVAAHGLQSASSVVAAHGLSCPAACGIVPERAEPVPPPLAGGFTSTAPLGKGSPALEIFTKKKKRNIYRY